MFLWRKLAYEYDQIRFTILEEIKSTPPKSLFYNYYSQIKSIQIKRWFLMREENRSTRGKKLSWQSRKPTNSIHTECRNRTWESGRQVFSPLGQPCHHRFRSIGITLLRGHEVQGVIDVEQRFFHLPTPKGAKGERPWFRLVTSLPKSERRQKKKK